jgi:hypothetical protein
MLRRLTETYLEVLRKTWKQSGFKASGSMFEIMHFKILKRFLTSLRLVFTFNCIFLCMLDVFGSDAPTEETNLIWVFPYKKNQLNTLISQIVFKMKLYMFRTVPLSIIRSYSLYTQQWQFVDSFLVAGSGYNWVPSRFCSIDIYKPVWHTPLVSVQWITPDDGQRNCRKYVEFHFENKIWEIIVSSCFL